MEQGSLRNILVRLFLLCISVITLRFAIVVTLRGESCDLGDFCFFSLPENLNVVTGVGKLTKSSSAIIATAGKLTLPDVWGTEDFQKAARFYLSIFQDLISDGYLRPQSKVLCLETSAGPDVFALKEIGIQDSIGISKKSSKPLVISGQGYKQPFGDETFDIIFSGGGMMEKSVKLGDFVAEIARTLKPEGLLVVHTGSKDTYSFNSFLDLFNCCKLVKTRNIDGFDSKMPFIREIVMKKVIRDGNIEHITGHGVEKLGGNAVRKCFVPGYKRQLIQKAEHLIEEEPQKPWITLKRNVKNMKYLPSMADISFKQRYIYIDVGARSYGSSIVSWFKKQYPKQNKTFDIYAIEADKTFHEQYKYKKGVTLLPYAAWVRNETLFFEINQEPSHKKLEKGRGMGRIQPFQSLGSYSSSSSGDVDKIQGFDFAEWLKSTVSKRDYVVMKMDVEGTEFDLIPRLFETGAICLIDEIFLECHYNRWQKCCPGERTTKYQKTYKQCFRLFTSLRESGVLVHQWW
ncbi:methyltransferase [Forsythia ovata]|uniref:Methyltransferase n=1 Tax=Forsythia ovata TaxID=205694 RepID=A0ABD1SJ68_9LAMI